MASSGRRVQVAETTATAEPHARGQLRRSAAQSNDGGAAQAVVLKPPVVVRSFMQDRPLAHKQAGDRLWLQCNR